MIEQDDKMRHGGPFDRGSADAYYGRKFDPHFFINGTGTSERVKINKDDMPQAYDEYLEGYEYQESTGEKKQW